MNLYVAALVTGMLVTGCANSILNKLQDNTCVENCDGPAKDRNHFEQPVFQTVQMFVAEMCCWLVFVILRRYSRSTGRREYQQIPDYDAVSSASSSPVDNTNVPKSPPRLRGKRLLLLAIPAFCDICGTTLMNIGLLYVPVSIYQMVRGSVVLFVGFESMVFLKRKISLIQWWGLIAVTAGVFLVGLSARFAAVDNDRAVAEGLQKTAVQVTAGIFMVLFGQVFTATQFVVEEYILGKYHMELIQVVSWEGTFGTSITVLGSTIIYGFIHGKSSYDTMFNLAAALRQVLNDSTLVWAGIAIMVSIAGFNFCGLSVTQHVSATSRSTVDTCRTIGIWFVSFLLGWESFQFLQLVGFAFLVYGTMMFNGLVHTAYGERVSKPNEEETDRSVMN